MPSTVPVALLGTWLWLVWPWPANIRWLVFSCWVAMWRLWTFQRNRVWQDPVVLFEDNAAKSPGRARVHANLGKAYLDRGRHQEARRSFERAIQLDPNLVGAYNNLAVIHLDHDPTRARSVLQDALARRFLALLGLVYYEKKDRPRAEVAFREALRIDPGQPMARAYLERLEKGS